jgi:hypothetical protein
MALWALENELEKILRRILPLKCTNSPPPPPQGFFNKFIGSAFQDKFISSELPYYEAI